MVALQTKRVAAGPLPVTRAYDLAAPFYDAWSWQAFWREHEHPIIRRILERYRRGRGRSLRVLDIGCGTGWYLDQLEDLCSERVGVDLSAGMLAVAACRLPGTLLWKGDARKMPFSGGRFDVALCTRMLSHVPQIRAATSEMRRTLVSGGVLILSDVDADHDYSFTKLPVSGGHVLADTYKHRREDVFVAVEAAGFVPDSAALIRRDGSVTDLRQPSTETVVGWVGSWRRTVAGLDEHDQPSG